MSDKAQNAPAEVPGKGTPGTGAFWILLATLWALNLADTFQTWYLKETGFLAEEANRFIDFFLREGAVQFFGAKILALVLVTSILARGWYDTRGSKFHGITYNQNQVRRAIYFLLSIGVVYYAVIVVFPFIAMFISGFFNA